MKIAICDDQPVICDELELFVEAAFRGTPHEFTYQSFYSGDALLQHLYEHPRGFQIYLLDIEMKGTDGLETARQIRRQDQDAVIIFITSHEELMPHAFRVLAFQYVVKPLQEEIVVEAIGAAVRFLEQKSSLYLFAIKKKIHSVYLAQIEYIESLGRKMIVHMTNADAVEYNGSLKDAMVKVEGASFAQAHQSFVVNLEQVAALDSWKITMRSGVEIRIGKKYHAVFHAAYRKFMLQMNKCL